MGAMPLRALSEQEAFSFENEKNLGWTSTAFPVSESAPEANFTQPKNKAEPCLVPMAVGYTKVPNFVSYWDGACKNGYAYGLGRDIMRNDLLEMDEVTVYSEGARNIAGRPVYTIVFTHKTTISEVLVALANQHKVRATEQLSPQGYNTWTTFIPGENDADVTQFRDFPELKYPQGSISQKVGAVTYDISWNNIAFNPVKYRISTTSVDSTSPQISMLFKSGEFATGIQSGAVLTRVDAPESYRNHLNKIVVKGFNAKRMAEGALASVAQMQERYYQKACAAKDTAGIPEDVFRQACTFRDELSEARRTLVAAWDGQSAAYAERAKEQALAQVRAQGQAQARQQLAVERSANRSGIQEFLTQLSEATSQFNRNATTTSQPLVPMPSGQVGNWGVQPSRVQNCMRMGNIVSCR
jgi:Tfp pilus assembly protein PilE